MPPPSPPKQVQPPQTQTFGVVDVTPQDASPVPNNKRMDIDVNENKKEADHFASFLSSGSDNVSGTFSTTCFRPQGSGSGSSWKPNPTTARYELYLCPLRTSAWVTATVALFQSWDTSH